jgi:SAM-dependent methyltransferase
MQRLILGPGKHTKKCDGDIFCDIRPFEGIDVVHDLNVVPWPFEDNQFSHVSAIHLVEHLRDLVAFMDEAWRVLTPGGSLYLETPFAGTDPDLEFCDPTHVRCYRPHTFINYFTLEGIQKFGYTERPWAIYAVGTVPGQPTILRFHGTPIN